MTNFVSVCLLVVVAQIYGIADAQELELAREMPTDRKELSLALNSISDGFAMLKIMEINQRKIPSPTSAIVVHSSLPYQLSDFKKRILKFDDKTFSASYDHANQDIGIQSRVRIELVKNKVNRNWELQDKPLWDLSQEKEVPAGASERPNSNSNHATEEVPNGTKQGK